MNVKVLEISAVECVQLAINTLWPAGWVMCWLIHEVSRGRFQIEFLITTKIIIDLSLCLQVGARSLETAVWGAFYNVKINLEDINDDIFSKQVSSYYITYHYNNMVI